MGETLGGQVSSADRDSVFANLPINGPDSGGSKVPFDWRHNRSPACPPEPAGAPPMDVTGSRSEPGHTRLSKDDGSIHKANSLKSYL